MTGEDTDTGVFHDFVYEESGVEGAAFELYAKDTIYSPDGAKDEQGNPVIRYEKDDLVATLVTDSEGKAVVNNLPLGSYYLKETVAGDHFVLNPEQKEFTLTAEDDTQAVVYEGVAYKNERQKISISVEKKDAVTEEKLEGVTVNLDTKEDIQAIDKAMEGLASTDVAKITAVEQFLSPAKVDLVNLMLKELVEDGQTVTATQENKEALQALLDEINQYYTGIPEADKKYVEGYEAVATVQAAIDALEEKDSDLNGGKPAPETGDHLPTAALLLVLAAGSTLLINRKRK